MQVRGCVLSYADTALCAARRHGDKAAEMQLVEFRTYVEAAEKLINENPLGLKRVALVSSEDPWVIEEASHLTALDTGVPMPAARVNARCLPWRHRCSVTVLLTFLLAMCRAARLCDSEASVMFGSCVQLSQRSGAVAACCPPP